MKKLIALSAILAVSVATVAEAKRGGGSFRSSPSKAVATKPVAKQQSQQTQQKDATFANTPNNAAAQQPARQGSTMANVAMGAAAGYILGDMMSSTAHANQPAEANAQQAVNSAQNVANGAVAEFKSIGGQIDPFLVEKTDGYRRYCISGVQYLIAAQGVQTSPVVMVNPNGTPLQCNLIP
ncbi:hypothetical protein A6B40_01550 [Mannheimia varigena]|uniref:Uncharacterized protein n=1 Tax=Mannheimia varigena USDA-ARS-USMARC-1296 TaxID=1433287 RepID=W0QBF6_9PAST|nr:hypothetical protein [Mannheimia varigena]AHG75632.1 hypothetical protein X808_11090 [Mannheimia varigena USDA-ARS-USMARC-1296]QLB16365.1 hypothetical protein A6B40_01550 [Mannheimia varigena]